MEEQKFRMDRTKVSAQTFEEANDHVTYWLDKTEDERLNAACFIINQIYGVTQHTKVDRTVTSCRKHAII